jgi:pimeloyl-ACP methyl ester carboxylesterase
MGNWKTGRISSSNCQLEYKYQMVEDKPWMVFLHGFGQDFRAFESMYAALENEFSFLAPNLFFHGESIMEGEKPLNPEEWLGLVDQIFQNLGISSAQWLGFSMGGKFLLLTYQYRPEYFSGIVLLAPDGIAMNPWYRFAARTVFGRVLLRFCFRFMPFLHVLIRFFSNIGLLKASVAKFAASQLTHSEGRELVKDTWLRFRNIWPNEAIWMQEFKKRPIPFLIGLGKYDSIIPKRVFATRRMNWEGIKWAEFEAGHTSLIERFASKMRKEPAAEKKTET